MRRTWAERVRPDRDRFEAVPCKNGHESAQGWERPSERGGVSPWRHDGHVHTDTASDAHWGPGKTCRLRARRRGRGTRSRRVRDQQVVTGSSVAFATRARGPAVATRAVPPRTLFRSESRRCRTGTRRSTVPEISSWFEDRRAPKHKSVIPSVSLRTLVHCLLKGKQWTNLLMNCESLGKNGGPSP